MYPASNRLVADVPNTHQIEGRPTVHENPMLLHYLRSALATLRLRRQTTLINVIGLALGFSCFIIAYVVAAYLASADKHFANVERIYVVQQRNVAPGDDTAKPFATWTSRALAARLRAETPELEAVARRTGNYPLRVDAGEKRMPLNVIFADPDILRIFDFTFVAGNAATALDDPRSALVTGPVAEQLFGTTDAIGRTFTVRRQSNRPVDVIVRGVVEEERSLSTMSFPGRRTGVLLNIAALEAISEPASTAAAARTEWSTSDFAGATYALLPSDGSLSSAELDRRLADLGARIAPQSGETVSFRARPLETYFDDQITAILETLGLVTGLRAAQLFFLPGLLILAMACFNYVNLTVAIAATRAKEVGMSKVLGASVRQVILQHLFEAGAAVAAAFVAGFVLAAMIMAALNNLLGLTIPFLAGTGLAFWLKAAPIVLATTLIAGAYPAWVMSRFRPLESLRIGSKRSGSSLLRSLFIGSQFAMASVLLTAVLVMFGQNRALTRELDYLSSDPYVQLDNNLLETPDADPELVTAALLASPSIKGVTGMEDSLWSATLESDLYSRSRTATEAPASLRTRYISYDYFSTLGIDLSAGRSFVRDRDRVQRTGTGESGQAGTISIVLEREAARLLGWANPADAVGETIYQSTRAAGLATGSALAFEVIGVVDRPPLQAMSGGLANIYRLDPNNTRLIVRLAPDDVPGALAHIAAVWARLVPDNPLRAVRFFDQSFEEAQLQMNLLTTSLLGIVAFGFLVALAGIFGMALFVANRRRHEIGIRKSLGAGARQILRQLVLEFAKPVLIGNVAAWPLAYLLGQAYVTLWFDRMPLTPWPYLLSLALTLGIAWFGFGRQALRAARLQPARVLRHE